MDEKRLKHLAGIVTEGVNDNALARADAIWRQIDDLFVDLMDEILELRGMFPESESIKRAQWYLENDELADFTKEFKAIRDKYRLRARQ